MDQQISSPIQSIYSNMVAEPDFYSHQEDERDSKAASSTRSPTTIFAVDELNSVFRVPDDAIERQDHQGKSNISRRRCLTPSFTTDGELSTFSEDTETDDEEEESAAGSSRSDYHHLRIPIRRRQPSLSIFRPVSGTKRRCEFEDEHDRVSSPTNMIKRSCSFAPLLCHASPIESDSDECDEISLPLRPSDYPIGSPFKRICRTTASSPSSPYTSLFAEALPATITNSPAGDTFSITPNHLQHPLSFKSPPILKATAIVDDDIKEKGI